MKKNKIVIRSSDYDFSQVDVKKIVANTSKSATLRKLVKVLADR